MFSVSRHTSVCTTHPTPCRSLGADAHQSAVPLAQVHQLAALVLGNFAASDLDPNAELTRGQIKASSGYLKLLKLLESEDNLTLVYSLGAIQNTCTIDQRFVVEHMQGHGIQIRLKSLQRSNDEQVAMFAASCLANIQQITEIAQLQAAAGDKQLEVLISTAASRQVDNILLSAGIRAAKQYQIINGAGGHDGELEGGESAWQRQIEEAIGQDLHPEVLIQLLVATLKAPECVDLMDKALMRMAVLFDQAGDDARLIGEYVRENDVVAAVVALLDRQQCGEKERHTLGTQSHVCRVTPHIRVHHTSHRLGMPAPALCCSLGADAHQSAVPLAQVHQLAALVLGNFAASDLDPNAELTRRQIKASSGYLKLLKLLESENTLTLTHTLGAIQNMCSIDPEFVVEHMQGHGIQLRLKMLKHGDDTQIAVYAANCLRNIQETAEVAKAHMNVRKRLPASTDMNHDLDSRSMTLGSSIREQRLERPTTNHTT